MNQDSHVGNETDLTEKFLKGMKNGEWLRLTNRGKLVEIHRVPDGWMYVFQLCNSQLSTQFVKETNYAEGA